MSGSCRRNRYEKKHHLFDTVNNTLLIIVALACIYPFLYVFFIACSDGTFLAKGEVSLYQKDLIWRLSGIFLPARNSMYGQDLEIH